MTCQPYAFPSHAGYILVDLDQAEPAVLETMCAHGHQPCVVLETSPGHLQAGVHVSKQSLPPAVASASAASWRAGITATPPAPLGGRWAGWQDAAIKNHAGVCPADWLPG